MTSNERVDLMMVYESGEANINQIIELFADLIKTGMAWTLQGSYGRAAQSFIEREFISEKGVPDWDYIESELVAEGYTLD